MEHILIFGKFYLINIPYFQEETPTPSPRVSLVRHRTMIEDQNNRFKSGILSPKVNAKKDDRGDIRRVSVLPSFLDDEEKGCR